MLTKKDRRGPRAKIKTLQLEDRFEEEKKEKTKKNLLRRLVILLTGLFKESKSHIF